MLKPTLGPNRYSVETYEVQTQFKFAGDPLLIVGPNRCSFALIASAGTLGVETYEP